MITEPLEKAETLNKQFQSVFTPQTEPKRSTIKRGAMPKITIVVEGVEAELKRLNPNKASGPGNLSPEYLKSVPA